MSKNIFWVFVLLMIVYSMSVYADDQFKPYLHQPSIPEHPKAKLYGSYTTNLFPGAGTYSYPIEIPKGTNNLQPSLSISYNSQSVKQMPSILGAAWSLTQNYIYHDVNFTPSNTTDDFFKLILNSASYDLIYNSADGVYHTKSETFARIQNISTTSNSYSRYWLITLKDGTQLRFGYNSDSELISNSYSYVSKWSLDQIQDTHGNKIFYSYLENPFSQDNGTSYLSAITYNNDLKRRIEFSYEANSRPDRRVVYEQGNKVDESRRLQDIFVLFNNSLVRRYNFEYTSLSNESLISSLSKIRYYGSDNASVLHQITFGYYESTSFYINSTKYNVTQIFSDNVPTDFGVRVADLNNDGFVDLVEGRDSTFKAYINNRTDWNQTSDFVLPGAFISGGFDQGLRIADLNNDGFQDLIRGYTDIKKAWINNGTGWVEQTLIWAQPALSASFVISDQDQGVQLVDFNGDGKVDLLHYKSDQPKEAYLNTGNGWVNALSIWVSPVPFVNSDGSDYGARLVDFNGDGLVDILQGYNFGSDVRSAWLNNGSGWINATSIWNPPVVFTSTSRTDNGVRFVDLNGDGLTDMWLDYKNGSETQREAFINNGNGWTNSTSWQSPEPFTFSGLNKGARIGDVNGDGLGDVIIGFFDGTNTYKRTLIRNSTTPYLLKNITNEFGGLTYLDYSASTSFNNTDADGFSDIGFNIWVVKAVYQNNSLYNDFNILSNTSYSYYGGKYDYNDSEFRGFNLVNETLSDKSVISHYFNQSTELKGKEIKTETYDSNSNIYSRVENNFNFTNKNNGVYFANLLLTSSYTFDGNSLNSKITNVSYKYDNYSNLISKIQFGDVSIQGDEKYENYSYAVNTSSWILDKPTWYLLFDSSMNKIRETKYFYDNKEYGSVSNKGELTKIEQYLDTGGGNPTTSYKYDSFGNLYQQTDSLGRTTTWDYGIRDDTYTYYDRIVNPLGHAIDYTWDVGTGNIINYIKHGVLFEYEYDTFGRIIKDIDPYDTSDLPTKKYEYIYDGIAPEIIKVSQKTTSNKTLDTYYVYDGMANLVQIKSSAENGRQVVKNLFYDGLSRVKEEQNPYFDTFSVNLSTTTNLSNKTRYNYDAVGRITSVINPDGTYLNTTYNKSIINDYDANGNRHTYVLDGYGRISEIREYNTDYYIGDNQTYNTTYSYNGADELAGIKDAYGNNFNFTYDSLGRKIKLIDPDLGTWTYSYNLAGNLVSQVGGGGNLVTGDSYYREYNGLGQLQRVREGNTSSGRILEEYYYDSNGDRIKINRYSYSGGSNETIYTPYREWMQIRNSSGTHNFYYIYEGDTLVARQNPDGTKWFYHSDHLGSTSLITDQNGNVVEDKFYSAYGESLSPNNAEENKLYTGQFKDTTGMYYYKTRYYKPDWTKFTQCDKIKPELYNPQLLNCYAYGLDNPYRYKDDSGNIPVDVVVDIGFIGYDLYKLAMEGKGADNENANALKLDIIGAAVPYATGLGAASRVARTTEKVADIKKVIQVSEKANEGVKVVDNAKETARLVAQNADQSQKFLKFTRDNFRENLARLTGKNPEGFEAHHTLPVKFERDFKDAGINIHDPKYGVWVRIGQHRSMSRAYNKEWERFFRKHGRASEKLILEFRLELMKRYGGG